MPPLWHTHMLTHLRHLHCSHGVNMQAEDLWAIVADNKALKLLLVHREIARLDVQIATTWETQHVLALCVPGHAVRIGLLNTHMQNILNVTENKKQELYDRNKALFRWGNLYTVFFLLPCDLIFIWVGNASAFLAPLLSLKYLLFFT